MNNIDIEKMKREIKVKVGGTVVFCGLLFTLMGCGKTVVDTTVEQQPTQTVETTIDDPVVDVPVEPTTDVSDNENADKEALLENATLVQTGENSYEINLECPDNSAAPEVQTVISRDVGGYFSGVAGMSGVPENLLTAVMAHGTQTDPQNPTELDFETWADKPVDVNFVAVGKISYVLTNDSSTYENVWGFSADDLNGGDMRTTTKLCAVFLQDCLNHTNGNVTCALTRYKVGPEVWDKAMQACTTKTGLTEKEVYDNFDAGFVLSFSEQELDASNYATEVLSYITPEEEIVITTYNSNGQAVTTNTYVVTIPKRYGSI